MRIVDVLKRKKRKKKKKKIDALLYCTVHWRNKKNYEYSALLFYVQKCIILTESGTFLL